MDNGMASVSQLNPYHCDQCGTANIVAAPVLYQQGTHTHTYSTKFDSGTTQSFSELGFKVKKNVILQAGWRYLDVHYRNNNPGFLYDVAQSGVAFGATIYFK